MVGVSIKIDDKQFDRAIKAMIGRIENKGPFVKDIAQEVYNNTIERFREEEAPDGTKWAALAPSTLAGDKPNRYSQIAPGQKVNPRKILQGLGMRGGLLGSINVQMDGDEAVIGTNKIYAAIHQFGGKTKAHTILPVRKKALAFGGRVVKKVNHPGSEIPARPFLGISQKDKDYIDYRTEEVFSGKS